MGRFSRSIALAKESFAVLKSHPGLAWFPIISATVTVLLSIVFFVPVFLATGGHNLESLPKAIGYPVMFAFYMISYFVVIFFNAGLVSCAHDSLMGRPTSFNQGLSNAVRHLPAILGWTLIAATVGMVLHIISERVGLVGKIVVAVIGGAWNIVTFFVVPVVAVEHGSPIAAVKKSGSLLRKTWGENLIGSGGIGLALFLLMLMPVIPFVAVCFTGMPVLIMAVLGLSVIYWLGLAAAGASLQGVYRTALYIYAETGEVPQAFNRDAIVSAFQARQKGKFVGYFRGR